MNKQLIKDFGRLLNDGRIGFCNVRNDNNQTDCGGVVIGSVVWASGNGSYFTLIRDLHITYDSLIDAVRTVYAYHPTRTLGDVLYSIKFNLKKNTFTLAVTNSSNLELFNVRHSGVSKMLRVALETTLDKDSVIYKTQYYDAVISNFDKIGGFSFTIA